MSTKSDAKPLELSDVGCPICLEILTEPITMPCNHTMCRPCFEKNIELTNLLCPFCKKRIGTWCRKAKKVESLVNKALWKRIQDQFPVLVEARLNGEESLESSGLFEVEWSHNICKNGDIGKEFEAQLDEMRRENEDRARAEENQSKKLIEELMKEEGQALAPFVSAQSQHRNEDEESKKLIREILKEERSSPFNTQSGSSSKKTYGTPTRNPAKNPAKSSSRDMRQFFKAVPSSTVTSQSEKENTELNSSQSELNSSSSTSGARSSSFYQNSSPFDFEQDEEKGRPDPVLGLEVTAELLELQMRLEASIAQQKEDEAMARRLQEEEISTPSDATRKRRRSGPRQLTLEELCAKKRKED